MQEGHKTPTQRLSAQWSLLKGFTTPTGRTLLIKTRQAGTTAMASKAHNSGYTDLKLARATGKTYLAGRLAPF